MATHQNKLLNNPFDKVLLTNTIALLTSLLTLGATGWAAAQDDTTDGEKLFKTMSEALVEPGKQFSQVIFIGENTIYNDRAPGGDVQMDTRKAYNFKEKSRRTDFKSPMGQISLFLEDGKAGKVFKGRKTPLRDYEIEKLKNGLNYHYLNIALHGEKYNPEFTGSEERDGTTYKKLKFNVEGSEVVYFLHPETHNPDFVQFQQYSDDAGGKVQVTDHYSDWRIENGVAAAYQKKSFEAGEISGSFKYESVKFE